MLKPAPMQRTVILASKSRQAAVIETLHELQAAHFVEFQENAAEEFAGFKIGQPLPGAGPASERLVRVRALLRHLGAEGSEAQRRVSVRDLEGRLDVNLDAVEREVSAAVESRESIRTQLAEGREMEAKLEPLRSLPLRLEDYGGYDTLTVFVGRADDKAFAELPRAAPDGLLVQGDGQLFAFFAPKPQADAAAEVLYRNGYAEVEVPEGKGAPDERVREIVNERAALEARLEQADKDLVRLANEHRDFLLAAEEHLSIAVEKAEAPLSFASTENAFVVDAWVPADRVADVEKAIRAATGDSVHILRLETEAHHHGDDHHHGHGTDQPHGGVDARTVPKEKIHAEHVAPPTKYDNPGGVRKFEWFVNLFSTPRYDEIDPTIVFSIFFPIFFGFMVGDLGLGILTVLIGWLLITKLPRVDGMKQLGTAFLAAGIVAAVFGGLVFKDALGVPLGVTHHMDELVQEAGIAPGAATCNDYYTLAHEPTWGCILGMGPVHAEPIVAKVTDVPTMLLLSILAAGVHLLIGLLFGIRNEMGHGGKHLAAKFGYLILLLTFFPAVIGLLRPDMFVGFEGDAAHAALTLHLPITQGQAFMGAGIGFLLGAVILGWAEGFGGVLEIPAMFTAIMSYLRLGAVAIAKGAMAIAFNSFTLIAALTGDGIAIVLGVIGFLIAQMVLLVLGLLSGGIQALRLNFVEFFTKFYKGGGTPYKPFGRARRVTLVNPSGATGAGPAGSTVVSAVLLNPNDTS